MKFYCTFYIITRVIMCLFILIFKFLFIWYSFLMLNFFKNYWHGKIELWKSYWIFAFIVNFILCSISNFIFRYLAFPAIFSFATNIIFNIFFFIGCWRSSNKYKKINFFSTFVKTTIVISSIFQLYLYLRLIF